MRHEEPSYGLFSFFTSKKSTNDRPRSALAMFTNPSPSVSPSLFRKESEDRGDILNLLRRSSGADSRASNDSSASRLPDNALVGLSDFERQHIMSVMTRSNRNTSPLASRRCSSALQMLPEVDNISEAEKEHIQNILERAESKTPFMIKIPMKKQISSRTESTNSRVSSEGIDEEVEIEEPRKKVMEEPIVEVPSRAVTPRNNLRVIPPPIAISHPTPPHSAKTDTGSKHSSGSSAHSQFGFSTPSISGFKTFFDKAKTATETLVKEIKDEVIVPEIEKEKQPEPVITKPNSTEELTTEEIEHIRKINEMAQFDETVPSTPAQVQERRKSSVVSGLKNMFGVGKTEEPELTETEKEHIRKMSLMADKMNAEIEVMGEAPKQKTTGGFGLKNFFGKATQSVIQATDSVIKNVQQQPPKQSLAGLTQEELNHIAEVAESAQQEAKQQEVTQEELDHIARIAAMAAEDFNTPMPVFEPKLVLPPTPATIKEPELSQEERDHIARIAALAADEFQSPIPVSRPIPESTEPELTEEERQHIARIAEMAAEDFSTPTPVAKPPPVAYSSEPELTEAEKEHIARIAAMAADDFQPPPPVSRPLPAPAEPELTEEERQHIARIAAMAADDFQPPPPVRHPLPAPTESDLTEEERQHIARIAAMAAEDFTSPESFAPSQQAEPELSQEERDHIARIAEMASEDFKQYNPYEIRPTSIQPIVPVHSEQPELSQEEKDHIARIAAMAAEDYEPDNTNPFVVSKPDEPTLTREELDHIARVSESAFEDFRQSSSLQKPAEPELTQEELEHIARIAEMAAMDFTSEPSVPSKPTQPDLTQEEIDHIARIAAMASEDIVPVREPELTKEELDHIAKINEMAERNASGPLPATRPIAAMSQAPPPPQHVEPDLTQEELDHIASIAKMADMDFTTPVAPTYVDYDEEPKTESGSDATSGADQFDEQEDSGSDAGSFNDNENIDAQVLTSGSYPDRVTSPAALDTTEEPQSPIMAQKVVSSSPSADSMASRKSSEYDIRSISEIRRESESDIGKWYEEQLSFMRQSIHDEEEDVGHEIPTDVEEFPLEYVEDQLHFLDSIAVESHKPISSFVSTTTGRSIGEECFGEEERRKNGGAVEQKVGHQEEEEEEEKTKKNSSREAFDDRFETQREDSVRAQQTPIDSVPGSRMLKRPNFGFLSNIANDAINKAKEAGSQIQAAVPIKPSPSASNIVNNNVFSNSKSSTSLGTSAPSKSIPSPQIDIPMDGLSEEERRQIMSVMAAADFDDSVNNARPSTSGSSNIPAGMEDLSEEERQKIMSVMANAEMEMGPPFGASSSQMPTRSPSVMSTSMMSEMPPGMEDLSEEERLKIMSVMAEADMQDIRQPVITTRGPPPMPPSTSMVPPGMEGLSEEERQKIMSVMANAEMDTSHSVISSRQPSRSPSVSRIQPVPPPLTKQLPIIPPGLEDLSEEERQKIMSVMADAEFEESRSQVPSRQPSRSSSFARPQQSTIPSFQPMPIIPPGLENLSEEERQKIMSVMANAEVEESRSQVPSRQPSRSPSFIQMQQPTMPIIPPGLEDLSEAERQKIMSVMAEAEVQNIVPSRSPSSYSMPLAPVIPPGLEDLSETERQKIMSVMAEAEIDSAKIPSRSPSTYSMPLPPPPLISQPDITTGLEDQSEAERQKILSVMAEAEVDLARVPSRSPSSTQIIPPGLESLSEEERKKIMSVMANAELEETSRPIEKPRGHTGFTPSGIVNEDKLFEMERKQREESPTRESGYATSTSYERELAMGGEERMDGLLEDILRIREGARSRRDSRDEVLQRREEDPEVHTPEEVPAVPSPSVSALPTTSTTVVPVNEPVPTKPQDDFDFTYSDSRFAEIVKMQEEEEITSEKDKPRPIQRAPSKPPPMIKITAEEETKSDSDEESCSEEDDEYPDRVVEVPTAKAPTLEEVEKERLKQEQLGKEVLQQIQAFGEVANDEFDVQWARTTTSSTPTVSSQPIVTAPRRSDPIPIAPSQRSKEIEEERVRTERLEEEEFYRHGHNPFLESPDEDEVSINMEDVEYAELARMYESTNQTMRRPGPVYTITEDESEDDGTLSNSESRLVAREKRLMDKKTAESLMAKYQKLRKVEVKPTTTTSTTTVSATATPAYAIISFTDPKTSTRTTDSKTYFETTGMIPPREIKDPKKDIPPEISASIDKTMAEVDALLGQVYTNEKSKPNLLCFDQSKFTNQPPTSTASTSTSDDLILLKNNNSTSPSFLLPLQSSVLGSQLDSIRDENERNENETTSPRGLKRSPGMLLPSPTSSSIFPMPPTAAESVGAAIGATTSSMFGGISIADPPSTLDKLTNSYKWLQNIE
ncbi:hypothetical protein CAEBREN_20723, partial [Caenorhabditis brenneri]